MKIVQRLRAGGIHLCISAFVAILACTLIFFVWYPRPYDVAQGVSRLVLIMIAVDVVLGPLITTLVYSDTKKPILMKMDFAIVGLLQVAALLYGLHTIYGGRPAYLVFAIDRFELVAIKDVDLASSERANPKFRPGVGAPSRFAVRMPADVEVRNQLAFAAAFGAPDLANLPEYFVPLADEIPTLLKRLRPMRELRQVNRMTDGAWQRLLAEFERPEDQLGYLPMAAAAQDGAVIIDARTGKILDIRLLTPTYGPMLPSKPIAPGEAIG